MVERPNEPGQDAIDAVNLSRIKKAQENSNSSAASYRGICASAQLQGLNLKATKMWFSIERGGQTAVEEFLDLVQEVSRIGGLRGFEMKRSQLELFQAVPQSAPDDERARIMGRSAGLDEKQENENPYSANSASGMAWLEGFRQGAAERKIVLSMAPPHPADEDEDDLDDEA